MDSKETGMDAQPRRAHQGRQTHAIEALPAGNTRRRLAATMVRSADDRAEVVRQAVAAAQEGDVDAFRYLYVRYADDVYRYVRRIVRDPHEAEDVSQQVFVNLMTGINKYEQRGDAPFLAWVLRVARNVAVDHLRRLRELPSDDVEGSAIDPPDDLLRRDRSLALRDALALLPA